MAAHPFGPIENQLIVGYYKRGKPLSQFRPKFNFKEVVVDSELTNPVYGVHQPVFYGWSPANGNSSSHDFRVNYETRNPIKGDMLLSRGLGYRITFTMPDQSDRSMNQPPLWTMQLAIVDIFGKQVLSQTEAEGDKAFESLPRSIKLLVGKYQHLEVEVTPLHVKIIENRTVERLFPVFNPNPLPNRNPETQWQEFRTFFDGYCDESIVGEYYDAWFLSHLKSMLTFLGKNHKTIDLKSRQTLKRHLELLVKIFVGGCYKRPAFWPEKLYLKLKGYLDDLLQGLETKIGNWLEGTGPYPVYFDSDMVSVVFKRITIRPDGGLLGGDPDDYSDQSVEEEFAEDRFLQSLDDLKYDPHTFRFMITTPIHEMLAWFLQESDSSQKAAGLQAEPSFESKSFTLISAQEDSSFWYFEKTEGESTKFRFEFRNMYLFGPHPGPIQVVSETDLLLGLPVRSDQHQRYYLLDLSATFAKRHKKNFVPPITCIEGPDVGYFQSSLTDATSAGISVLGIPIRDPRAALLMCHSLTRTKIKWAILYFADTLDFRWCSKLKILALKMASRRSRIFTAFSCQWASNGKTDPGTQQNYQISKSVIDSANPYIIVLACSHFDSHKNTLKRMYFSTLSWDVIPSEIEAVWLQAGKRLFGCFFSCLKPRIWVAVNHNRRFISLASRSGTHLNSFDFSNRFTKLEQLLYQGQTVGILGHESPIRTESGRDCYRIARIYFG